MYDNLFFLILTHIQVWRKKLPARTGHVHSTEIHWAHKNRVLGVDERVGSSGRMDSGMNFQQVIMCNADHVHRRVNSF